MHSQLVCLEKCPCGNSLSPRHLLYVGFDSQASHVHLLLNALFGKCSSFTGNPGAVLPLEGSKFVLRHSSPYATTSLIWLFHFISNSSLLTFFWALKNLDSKSGKNKYLNSFWFFNYERNAIIPRITFAGLVTGMLIHKNIGCSIFC